MLVAGGHDLKVVAERLCRPPYNADADVGIRIMRIYQHADRCGLGHQLVHELELLGLQQGAKKAIAGGIAAG